MIFTRSSISGKETDFYCATNQIFETLLKEIKFHAFSRGYLTRQDSELLIQYYSSWTRASNVPYVGYCFTQRLKNLARFISECDNTVPSVLDCGCGMGSESIACTLLGAKVVGVDLSKKRIGIAKKRLGYYRDRHGIRLDVNFLCKEILKYRPKVKFDIVYAKEFISHVWSLPAFFKFARDVLKERGYLIITDANLFNPYIAFKAYLDHRTALFTVVHDPETDEKVLYARERLFSPRYIAKVFVQHGFKPTSTSILGYSPCVSRRFLSFARKLEGLASKVPIGATYEISGVKIA